MHNIILFLWRYWNQLKWHIHVRCSENHNLKAGSDDVREQNFVLFNIYLKINGIAPIQMNTHLISISAQTKGLKILLRGLTKYRLTIYIVLTSTNFQREESSVKYFKGYFEIKYHECVIFKQHYVFALNSSMLRLEYLFNCNWSSVYMLPCNRNCIL